ncbi:hypothetical protein ABTW95_26210 [Spirillospora sp. NPDC127506]
MIKRIKAWWRRRRQKARAAAEELRTLREFVYLDEVSVTSLLSSRLGALPSEFTDTLTDSTRAELNSEFAGSAGVIKPRIGSRLETTRTQNSQVLRKATIQATFRDLYINERESLAMRPVEGRVPVEVDIRSFLAAPTEFRPWIIEAGTLDRGKLAEVEVELRADDLYRVNAILSSFAEMAASSADFSSVIDRDGLRKATEMSQLLDRLMGGLVPIYCLIPDYSSLTMASGEYLIHRDVAAQLPASALSNLKPTYLVGVAEQNLFWKDVRRVLFSGSRMRVLCRLNQNGLRDSWTAVKLVNVLGEVSAEIAQELESLGPNVLRSIVQGGQVQSGFVEPRFSALVSYGELLAQHYGIALDEADRSRLEVLAGENAELLVSVIESREGFRAISEFISSRRGGEIEPVVAAKLRMNARRQAGLETFNGSDSIPAPNPQPANQKDGRLLDAEIVAIYW